MKSIETRVTFSCSARKNKGLPVLSLFDILLYQHNVTALISLSLWLGDKQHFGNRRKTLSCGVFMYRLFSSSDLELWDCWDVVPSPVWKHLIWKWLLPFHKKWDLKTVICWSFLPYPHLLMLESLTILSHYLTVGLVRHKWCCKSDRSRTGLGTSLLFKSHTMDLHPRLSTYNVYLEFFVIPHSCKVSSTPLWPHSSPEGIWSTSTKQGLTNTEGSLEIPFCLI